MSKKEGNAFRAISLVMILTLAGKLLGLFRDRLMAVTFGSGMETNAFLTASRIPRVFFDVIFASAIAASFIPVFSETLMKKGRRDAMAFAGNFMTVTGLAALLLTALGMLLAEPLIRIFAGGFDAQTAALCVKLTRIMFPTVAFTAVAFSFVGVLQSLGEFNVPALISVIANLVVIAYYYTFNERYGIFGLAAAFLTGWFLQGAVQVPSLVRRGFYYRPSLRLGTEGMKKVGLLMLPVLVSTWVQPINLTINTRFGSHLFNGAGVTAVDLSNNLYMIIAGVFVLSVTNVIFPRLSRLSAGNEASAFRQTLDKTVRSSLFIVVPMTAGLMALARPIVELVYGGGAFDAFSVLITSSSLRFVALGMPGYTVQMILSRAYFARQDGRTPLIAGIASIAVNTALSALLVTPLDVTGLALASAAAATVNALVLMIPLEKRRQGFLSRAFAVDLLKMAAAAALTGLAAQGLAGLLDGMLPGTAGKLLTAVVPAGAGAAVYFIATALLGVTEARAAGGLLRRLIKR